MPSTRDIERAAFAAWEEKQAKKLGIVRLSNPRSTHALRVANDKKKSKKAKQCNCFQTWWRRNKLKWRKRNRERMKKARDARKVAGSGTPVFIRVCGQNH